VADTETGLPSSSPQDESMREEHRTANITFKYLFVFIELILVYGETYELDSQVGFSFRKNKLA
jgi:hypothetical protein